MIDKKIALVSAIAASLSLPVCADTLGVYVGGHIWQNEVDGGFSENDASLAEFSFKEETTASIYAKFEHPVPLVPNLRLRTGTLESTGNTRLTSEFSFGGESYMENTDLTTDLDFANSDVTLYWELLDNELVGLDFGLTAKYLSGEFDVSDGSATGGEDASLWIPMAYVGAKVAVPMTGVFVYGDVNVISYDDNSIHDYEIGVGYSFVENIAVDMSVTAGYREVSIELDDVDDINADLQFEGYFAGIEFHF